MTELTQNQALRAGLYMVVTTACFVGGDTSIKLIGVTLPLGEIIGLVGLVSTLSIFVICASQGMLKSVGLIFSKAIMLRSTLDVTGSFMFVAALMHMPLANISSVMQSVPLVVAAFGVVFLGERAGFARMAAVVAGFIGVLLIVKPTPQTISIYEFLAIGTVVVVALRDLVTKRIGGHVPLLIIALGNAVFITLGGFGFGLMQGFQSVGTWQMELLAGAGLLVTCGYILIVATVRLGELSATAPFRYAEVVFAIIAGILVFNEYPDFLSYGGMALIIAAGLYAAHNEATLGGDGKADLMPPAF
jgi:drug/metabolite transporter (DMT)-like permease